MGTLAASLNPNSWTEVLGGGGWSREFGENGRGGEKKRGSRAIAYLLQSEADRLSILLQERTSPQASQGAALLNPAGLRDPDAGGP